jgi:hypothetical protein|tara:strand:+ start:457 stop:645 length:189 start_codon:yes stop_codon:yes gene_type:complete
VIGPVFVAVAVGTEVVGVVIRVVGLVIRLVGVAVKVMVLPINCTAIIFQMRICRNPTKGSLL